MKTFRPARSARSAFTLLELTLVIALLGVLMAIVVTSVTGSSARAKVKLARAGLKSVKASLDTYNIEYSSYPPDLDTMARIKPPMVEGKNLKDPWEAPYVYDPRKINDEQPFMLASSGPDKIAGNEDDVSIWDEKK